MTYRKKLIEVALPLEAINEEASRRKRKAPAGYPTMIHKWWAQRPLAACRAVLFASLVDDPSSRPEEFPTEEAQDRERQRLFRLIEELVKWESSTNETVLAAARAEIMRSTDGNPPPVLDPFCGGGSIPLEAQRLGLEAHGSDLNPVPVLITKALIEIPPKFAGRPPVNPAAQRSLGRMGAWKGAAGLAEDVRYYGRWMRDEAERRIGQLYPKVRLPAAQGGGEATVIAWLWARTITCPNPACGARMPLVRSFALSTKKGKEVWVEPVVSRKQLPPTIGFEVRTGRGTVPEAPKTGRGANFRCLACGDVAAEAHVKAEAMAGRMGAQLMAIVAEGRRQRVYLSPDVEHERIAAAAQPAWGPDAPMPDNPRWFSPPFFGLDTYEKLFTRRQLVALTAFSDLTSEVRERVVGDALMAGLTDDGQQLVGGGAGAAAYADAVATYLAFALSRAVDYNCNIASWRAKDNAMRAGFSKQALPMVWDYAEGNPFGGSSSGWTECVDVVAGCLEVVPARTLGAARQEDARALHHSQPLLISTDPPYYDNIGYADLSDFFYVWLRHTLSEIYPSLSSTLLTPKAEELIASPYRFAGDKGAAQRFFEVGLGDAFGRMRELQDERFPLTVFYAFKQSESTEDDEVVSGASESVISTGWETMLDGLIGAGFLVDGTWPMRTEGDNRSVSIGTNALASSILLVCRPRPTNAPSTTRRQFLAELQRELPSALRNLQHGNIAPVDLAQAAIGPGMAVFSRYARVLESDGQPMRVRTALALINQVLAETLAEQEGEMDADTRWALTWFDENGFGEGQYGRAEVLATAKNTAMPGLVAAGIVLSARGKTRLLRRDELAADWDPATDTRRTVWEATHHLSRALESNGEAAAAALLARLGEDGERARDLAYRLYTTCERRGWAQDAQAYNALVVAWPELTRLAMSAKMPASASPDQSSLAL